MFGGADPTVPQLVPADIEVLRNHMSKPTALEGWRSPRTRAPSGRSRTCSSSRTRAASSSKATSSSATGRMRRTALRSSSPFATRTAARPGRSSRTSRSPTTSFATSAAASTCSGRTTIIRASRRAGSTSGTTCSWTSAGSWGAGRLFQLLDGTNNVTIAHNTALQTGSILFGGDHAPHTAFVFQNNIAPHNENGIIGSSTQPGNQTLARYFPRAVVRGNVIVGGRRRASIRRDNLFVGFARRRRRRTPAARRPACRRVSRAARRPGRRQPCATAQGGQRRGRRSTRDRCRRRHTSRATDGRWPRCRHRRVLALGGPALLRLRRLSAHRRAARARLRPRPVARAVRTPNCTRRRFHFPSDGSGTLDPTVVDRRGRLQRGGPPSRRASRTCWRSTTRPTGSRSSSAPMDRPDDTVDRARRYESVRRAGARLRHSAAASRRCSTRSCRTSPATSCCLPTRGNGSSRRRCAPSWPTSADPAVGAVSGELMLEATEGTATCRARARLCTGATRS